MRRVQHSSVLWFTCVQSLVLQLDYDGHNVPLFFDDAVANYESLAKAWLAEHPFAVGGGCKAGDSYCIVNLLVESMRSICQESGTCIEPQHSGHDSNKFWILLLITNSLLALMMGYIVIRRTSFSNTNLVSSRTFGSKTPRHRRAKSAIPLGSTPSKKSKRSSSIGPTLNGNSQDEPLPGTLEHRAAWLAMWNQASLGSIDDSELFDAWYRDMFPQTATSQQDENITTICAAQEDKLDTISQRSTQDDYEFVSRFSNNLNTTMNSTVKKLEDHCSRLQ
mmetsp:Transcript_3226/g.4244  ORF Transcript_3226/g.4244 Transcript_3226/m.4244 type:complete len:278 (+) Transcript_3226:8-841(+)